jgi:glycosyltransferase involved in cell wall biosynthesis
MVFRNRSMPMNRLALVHPHLTANGGGSAVAAWALQALRDTHEVSLITWAAPDFAVVNRTFGTSLRPGDATLRVPPRRVRALIDALPGRGRLLRRNALIRLCAILDRRRPFDVILHSEDEGGLPRPGIQYVHCPHAFRPPSWDERSPLQKLPGMIALHRALCALIWRHRLHDIRSNRTLVNSEYIAALFRDLYGAGSEVVYPPVPGGFRDVAWEQRGDGVACISRLIGYKRVLEVVAIVAALRRRGHDLALHVIGTTEDPIYVDRLRAAAAENEWLHVHANLPREEMLRIVSEQRYGLHGLPGEHFGIGPAELVRAGCVTFVPTLGGPAEIVGRRRELLFANDAEAVERIERVLESPPLQHELRRHLAERAQHFSAERFMSDIRRIAGEGVR